MKHGGSLEHGGIGISWDGSYRNMGGAASVADGWDVVSFTRWSCVGSVTFQPTYLLPVNHSVHARWYLRLDQRAGRLHSGHRATHVKEHRSQGHTRQRAQKTASGSLGCRGRSMPGVRLGGGGQPSSCLQFIYNRTSALDRYPTLPWLPNREGPRSLIRGCRQVAVALGTGWFLGWLLVEGDS